MIVKSRTWKVDEVDDSFAYWNLLVEVDGHEAATSVLLPQTATEAEIDAAIDWDEIRGRYIEKIDKSIEVTGTVTAKDVLVSP